MEAGVQRDRLPDKAWKALTQLKTYMVMAAKAVRKSFRNSPALEEYNL